MATTRKKQKNRRAIPETRRRPGRPPTAAARAPPSPARPKLSPIALVIGVVSCAFVGLVLVLLSQSAPRLAGQNAVAVEDQLSETDGSPTTSCQRGETLPKDTAAIRLSLSAPSGFGPRVSVRVARAGRELTRGTRPAGWSGDQVSVPVERVTSTVTDTRVCVSLSRGDKVAFLGSRGGSRDFDSTGRTTSDRIAIEYLRPGSESWWAYIPTMVHRMGFGRAWTGAWIALLALALVVAMSAVALAHLLGPRTRAPPDEGPAVASEPDTGRLRATLRRVPRGAWICALVALLNAFTWAVITPPFQAPDELDHFAYVQVLAETGHPPSRATFRYSDEEQAALRELKFPEHLVTTHVGVWSSVEQDHLTRALDARLDRAGHGAAGTAGTQPPLYYALEAVPYKVASGASLLHRLFLMRLLSALLGALAVVFIYLFVREALPGAPWAWTIAGLATALQPVYGYTVGTVNADALLFASAAALLYCLARAFRRGLTTRLSIAIGACVAVGFLSKLTFIALVPGVLLALVALALRQEPGARLRALRLPALAIAVGLAPIMFNVLLDAVAWSRPAAGSAAGALAIRGDVQRAHGSLIDEINYLWQLYVLRLPGAPDKFPSQWMFRDGWVFTFLGRFGYSGPGAPGWLLNLTILAALPFIALAGRAVVEARATLRGRALEFATYALMAAGLMGGIGIASYGAFLELGTPALFQARYFFPLAALMAAVVALVARGGGRRFGPAVGVLIVLLVLGHQLVSQLVALSSWYG